MELMDPISFAAAAAAGMERGDDEAKGPWTQEEDEVLKAQVAVHGARNWTRIAESIPGRSGKSCRLRWLNQLAPTVKGGPFTPEEDAVILWAHLQYGNKWASIARHLPGRTDNHIKNRWNCTLKKRHNEIMTALKNEVGPDGVVTVAAIHNVLIAQGGNRNFNRGPGGPGAAALAALQPGLKIAPAPGATPVPGLGGFMGLRDGAGPAAGMLAMGQMGLGGVGGAMTPGAMGLMGANLLAAGGMLPGLTPGLFDQSAAATAAQVAAAVAAAGQDPRLRLGAGGSAFSLYGNGGTPGPPAPTGKEGEQRGTKRSRPSENGEGTETDDKSDEDSAALALKQLGSGEPRGPVSRIKGEGEGEGECGKPQGGEDGAPKGGAAGVQEGEDGGESGAGGQVPVKAEDGSARNGDAGGKLEGAGGEHGPAGEGEQRRDGAEDKGGRGAEGEEDKVKVEGQAGMGPGGMAGAAGAGPSVAQLLASAGLAGPGMDAQAAAAAASSAPGLPGVSSPAAASYMQTINSAPEALLALCATIKMFLQAGDVAAALTQVAKIEELGVQMLQQRLKYAEACNAPQLPMPLPLGPHQPQQQPQLLNPAMQGFMGAAGMGGLDPSVLSALACAISQAAGGQ